MWWEGRQKRLPGQRGGIRLLASVESAGGRGKWLDSLVFSGRERQTACMDQFRMSGGYPLQGRVQAAGSKNAALPILAATLLTDGPTSLKRVPELVDTHFMGRLLTQLGMDISRETGLWKLHVSDDSGTHADYDLVRQMRGSICVLGPLLARRREARISLPGGCVISTVFKKC